MRRHDEHGHTHRWRCLWSDHSNQLRIQSYPKQHCNKHCRRCDIRFQHGITFHHIQHLSRITTRIRQKVFQVIDHCTIYLLIAGTYTPILLTAFVPTYPKIGWGLLVLQWGLGTLAAVLTAIDLETYKFFSMICYIFMGWSVVFFIPQALEVLGIIGFTLILWGGIAYTIGAILFEIGAKIRWFHTMFHIFVILGSILQYLGIYLNVL